MSPRPRPDLTTPASIDTAAPVELTGGTAPTPRPVLLTAAEVADQLRVDVVTIRRYAARGELTAYRVGRELRFTLDDVRSWLDARRTT